MYMPADKIVDNMFQGARQAAETNLRLQQELLTGWTRFWPGFSGRTPGAFESLSQFPREWTNAVMEVAHSQRRFVGQQFDSAIASLDAIIGVAQHGPDVMPSAEQPPPVIEREFAAPAESPSRRERSEFPVGAAKNIYQKVAVVTGAASGIGEAVARELSRRGARAVMLVDRNDAVEGVAKSINDTVGHTVAIARIGDATDAGFRKRVFNDAVEQHGLVTICVPAAGITRDALSVRIDKETGKAIIYPLESFRQVTEVNLLAPIYWGIEMVARIAEDRKRRGLKRWDPDEKVQGVVVFLGSVSSQGNKGQIAYAVAKAGLEGAAATIQKEAIFYGVRCGVIHPGFTDTPMVRALGEEFLDEYVLPYTQLRRLIHPDEIADAICFMISNSAVSGELWADAGWHPPA